MDRIVLKSRVGTNGILELTVPVGVADADREGDFERPEQGELQEWDPLQL